MVTPLSNNSSNLNPFEEISNMNHLHKDSTFEKLGSVENLIKTAENQSESQSNESGLESNFSENYYSHKIVSSKAIDNALPQLTTASYNLVHVNKPKSIGNSLIAIKRLQNIMQTINPITVSSPQKAVSLSREKLPQIMQNKKDSAKKLKNQPSIINSKLPIVTNDKTRKPKIDHSGIKQNSYELNISKTVKEHTQFPKLINVLVNNGQTKSNFFVIN